MKRVKGYFSFENTMVLLAFFLPINEKCSTILILIALVAFFIALSKNTNKLKWNQLLFILPVIFLAYFLSTILFSDSFEFKWIEQRASLLAFPILFLGFKWFSLKKIVKAFIVGCVVSYLLCFGYSIFNSVNIVDGHLIFEPLLNTSRGFFQAIVYEGNYFFGKHFSVLLQTSYFGFYLTLALSALLVYNKSLFQRKFLILFGIILILGILQTMGQAALFGLFILVFIIISAYIKTKKAKVIAYFSIIGLVIITFYSQPRIKILVADLLSQEVKLNPEGNYGVMLRLLSWDATIDVILENPIVGVGVPNAQIALNCKYEEKNYVYPLKKNLNSHNQFLQTTLEMGVFGLLLLLVVFYFLYKKMAEVGNNDKIFILSFTLLIGFNFLFEVYFMRYIGISVFSFFYCVCVTICEKRRK